MTILTIDKPITFSKTHFIDQDDLISYFTNFIKTNQRKKKWITTSTHSEYLQKYKNNEDLITMPSDISSLSEFSSFISQNTK